MFPDVLGLMSDQLEWTQSLGDAFLAQEDDVFARVQFLRQKADAAGNLKSNKQQTVKKQTSSETKVEYIVIEPAQPQYVYVPVYQPTIVYGSCVVSGLSSLLLELVSRRELRQRPFLGCRVRHRQ